MLTRYDIQTSLDRESALIKHLVAKLRPEHLAFRLTPAQRSTEELVRYIAIQLEGLTAFFIHGDWSRWEVLEREVATLTVADFPAAMDRQLAGVERLLATVPDAEFATRMVKTPAGEPILLAQAMLEWILKYAAAYKMQLFLQAKAAGLGDLASSNLWRGQDAKPKS
jgi:hypothetical protein